MAAGRLNVIAARRLARRCAQRMPRAPHGGRSCCAFAAAADEGRALVAPRQARVRRGARARRRRAGGDHHHHRRRGAPPLAPCPHTLCAPPPVTPTVWCAAAHCQAGHLWAQRSGRRGAACGRQAGTAATYPPVACPRPSGIAAAEQHRHVPRRRGFQDSKLELRPRPPQPRFAEVAIVSKMACIGADVRLRACARARLRSRACGVRHASWRAVFAMGPTGQAVLSLPRGPRGRRCCLCHGAHGASGAVFATGPTGQAVLNSRPSADGLVVTSESMSFLYIPKVPVAIPYRRPRGAAVHSCVEGTQRSRSTL